MFAHPALQKITVHVREYTKPAVLTKMLVFRGNKDGLEGGRGEGRREREKKL
jgi:hypothetical protein